MAQTPETCCSVEATSVKVLCGRQAGGNSSQSVRALFLRRYEMNGRGNPSSSIPNCKSQSKSTTATSMFNVNSQFTKHQLGVWVWDVSECEFLGGRIRPVWGMMVICSSFSLLPPLSPLCLIFPPSELTGGASF